ncbi:C4-dicarboxylate TRAP transporter substrate-binding protein [Vibrio sp. Isolate33]|uniref:C4-dicarboxylate TRAP transporter substrate-binding protein n=1 Tax=Vibrio sp. Isolate33 TaxID=2908539 RepID=UPI001EFE7B5D|nr:C4-dicarboxylate TRAP transporter substrate-binding protein [Vibrio sp. Isolate33]MCG9545837.1 C4-dicarboxylate TRAP transporter substrate-binding protein [Vibrio sp. Isolate33]
MKKLLGTVIMAATLLVGCGEADKAGSEAKDEPININMSLVFTQNELLTQELIKATDKIRERTDGSVNIKVFPGGQLPVYKDNLEQVVNGANWIAVEDLTYLGDYVPDFAALAGPMLYNTYDEYLAMMDTEFVAGLKAKAEEKGIKVLNADFMFGFRHMITNKEIVNSEDMKGMRIRVPQSQLFISTLSAMGAAPASLPFPETYAGVQQGVVDGLEGSILTMYSTKIYEVAKNMSLTKHFLGTVGIYISPTLWDKFTPEQQQIINEELEAGAESNTAELVKLDVEYTQKLEELGVTFNEVNSDEFNQLTADVYNQFPTWSEGIHATIMKELETIRAAQ